MDHKIRSAFISVFYKDGLEPVVRLLHEQGVHICSTGGTRTFITTLGIPCTDVEEITGYPSILGGRVKTLHPKVFGGILARRSSEEDMQETEAYAIPLFDLVIVDLYPFEETVRASAEEQQIIEKIDIGGISLIRAAAKNYKDVLIVASRDQYKMLLTLLKEKGGMTGIGERKAYAAAAFTVCARYDIAIASYFDTSESSYFLPVFENRQSLRYGENPHQQAAFYGDMQKLFTRLGGKELSYNNLVDTDAACQLIREFEVPVFAIIKHTNVCGIAIGSDVTDAWNKALAGDPESAFGGVLVTNQIIHAEVAAQINQLFFEILIAPDFEEDALALLKTKKNRVILRQQQTLQPEKEFKRILNGVLIQESDHTGFAEWEEAGARPVTEEEKQDLVFANIVCKHLKSNAIALVKDRALIGKGCGQTSRVDALRQAVDKSRQSGFDTRGAALASDAFFPFDDCARIAYEAGISAIIQPGGSVRDKDTIQFCKEHGMGLVMTGTRHFRHG